jgi:hypothetical protein
LPDGKEGRQAAWSVDFWIFRRRNERTEQIAFAIQTIPRPFPAAHEDAMTAWRFLRRQGIAADHIAVGGDSAVGNLPLALIERLHAAASRCPAAPGWSRLGAT